MQQPYHTIFPGGLTTSNRGAIDWGQQGLLAYGSWNYIVVSDIKSDMKRIQTLDGHSKPITKLRWSKEQLHLNNEPNFSLMLASGDEGGSILVWRATEASIVASLNADGQDKLGSVIDMEWHPDKPHLLTSVHSPSSFVLWNIETSSLIWRCDFGETLVSLSMNPFDKQHVCLSSNQGWIYFVRDFKEDSKPVRVDVKYRINSGNQQSDSLSSSKNAISSDSFQHMLFSPHHRNLVYFVLDHRILIFDLNIHQTIGSIAWDKNKPSFKQLLVSKHYEHLLFVLHEDGSLTTWRRRESSSQSFAHQGSIDVIRVSKQTRKRDRSTIVTCAAMSPNSELLISLISSDGVTWCISYQGNTCPVDQNNALPTLLITGEMESVTGAISSISVWNSETFNQNTDFNLSNAWKNSTQNNNYQSNNSKSSPSKLFDHNLPTSLSTPYSNSSSLYNAGKVDTSTNSQNLVAVGTHDGRLLLVDMFANSILRIFNVHAGFALRGVRWITSHKLICFTTENIEKHMYKNRIKIIDLSTGQIKEIRKKNEPEPTFIRGIRLSPSKLYLIVLLKDQPCQVWELKTGSLLRALPFPHLTALEWNPTILFGNQNASPNSDIGSTLSTGSPYSSLSSFGSASAASFNSNFNSLSQLISPDSPAGSASNSFRDSMGSIKDILGSFGNNSASIPIREQFVFSNPDGSLHFYQVENSQVAVCPNMKIEHNMGIVASLAWKDNLLVAGDTNGTIMSYNLEKKKMQTFEPGKGLVRRIRFSPAIQGSNWHHILVLFNDGDFGIWDLDFNVRVSISSYFRAKDLKAIDLDWWSSTQPIVATTDGAIRLVDKTLSQGSNSPLLFSHISYPLNCPLILPPRQALYLKVMLTHPGIPENMPNRESSANGFGPSKVASTTASKSGENQIQTSQEVSSQNLSMQGNILTGLVPDTLLQDLSAPDLPIVERALLIAQYFGNPVEERFWTLVIHAFNQQRTPPLFRGGSLLGPLAYQNQTETSNNDTEVKTSVTNNSPAENTMTHSSSSLPLPNSNTIDIRSDGSSRPNLHVHQPTLPPYFDLLLDPEQLRTHHMTRAQLHEKKRAQNYLLTQNITDFHLTLGQKEKAMELLLETPPDNNMYYADVLKACVVAGSISPETFRNTVKLVGTSLIANGSIDEGVQLLSLIGKSLDACRYLQSHDRWIEAAQLAKLTLSYDDAGHIYKKWAEHLVSEGQFLEAIEIEITLGEYDVVLALLNKAKLYELAALFALAAKEQGILTPEWMKAHPTDLDTAPHASSMHSLPALLESVFLDYGFYLNKIGCTSAAYHFLSNFAGEAGAEMCKGLFPSNNTNPPSFSSILNTVQSNPTTFTVPESLNQSEEQTKNPNLSEFASLVGSGLLLDIPPQNPIEN